MESRSVFSVDVALIAATLTLVVVGVLFIYSSGVTVDGISVSTEWIRQVVWAVLGLAIMASVAILDYGRLRDAAVYAYLGLLVLLLITLVFGRTVKGARAWLGIGDLGVQPSEFMKVATILVLARYFERHERDAEKLSVFALGLGITLLPVGIILMQPDLGTALVFFPVFLAIAFLAGSKPAHVLFIAATALVTVVLTVLPAWREMIHQQDVWFVTVLDNRNLLLLVSAAIALVGFIGLVGAIVTKRGYFRGIAYAAAVLLVSIAGSLVGRRVLRQYQLMRLLVFLDPYVDPRGAGWNIIQSVTAVGSGGITGKGWLRGTQSHLQYLPEQSTDFIFSILAEEWGFVGVALVFVCFALIMARGLIISANAKDRFAALSAGGVVAMLFFHLAVNIGMAIGVMPITGIPLIFVSYGGSSLWSGMIAVGLLMSIYQHRYRY